MNISTVILFPVYNDWASLQLLLDSFELEWKNQADTAILVVNDGSTENPGRIVTNFKSEMLHLNRNLGHQKAIAIGLAYIREKYSCKEVIVSDADGEDRAADAVRLLEQSGTDGNHIIFARRTRRANGVLFGFFYGLYKLTFYLFTGKKISFGNFSIIPFSLLTKLVNYSEIWNNYPGGVIRSRLPYTVMAAERGKRYAGESKMNFPALLLHGFGAIAVFLDRIIARVVLVSFILILFSVVAIATIVIIKTTTNLAIPGWASIVGTSLLIILLLSFIISLVAILIFLSTQSQRRFIPSLHYRDYILNAEPIN